MHYISCWMVSACDKVMVYGDSIDEYANESCLVVINHQSDADPLIVMVAWRNLQVSVVLEDIFHGTHFGLMLRLRGDFFIHQGKEQRHLQAALIQDQMRRYAHLRDPRWCVVFPEGGFFEKRKQRNLDYAKKNGYPILENALLPRLGALRALLEAEPEGEPESNGVVKNGDAFHHIPKRSFFRHIIDVTVAYPDRKPARLIEMLLATNPISHVAMHFRVKKLDQLSSLDEEHLRTFMYDLWTEKDQLLKQFYDTGAFPDFRCEDKLKVDYLLYLRGYCLVIPILAFYAFCIWSCLSYCWLLVTGLFQSLISLVF